VEGTDKKVFETLQNALFEFINSRRWTSYDFKVEERIECTILLNITDRPSFDEFRGTMNLVLRRPVYNTAYNSTLLNYIDEDVQFKYVEYEPLDFVENSYTNNLTSIIAFWVYTFIGMDFDSFSRIGGTPFFEKAQSIVQNAQNSPYPGWKAFEGSNNRYWLAENFTNPAYKPVREFVYEYHLRGLDVMSTDVEQGRSNIIAKLELLQRTNRERPGLLILTQLINAKRDEFINLFSEGSPTQKTKAVNALKEIDPANSSKYQTILN